MVFQLRQVWRCNLLSELADLETALRRFPILSIDVQHPHFTESIAKPSSLPQQACLYLVSYLVNRTQMIQLGITAADGEGNIGGTWQFNFRYSVWEEVEEEDSVVDFGTDRADIEWERLEFDGDRPASVRGPVRRVIGPGQTAAAPDRVGYLQRSIRRRVLGEVGNKRRPAAGHDGGVFPGRGRVFGSVVDVKCLAGHSPGLANTAAFHRDELAKELGVRRRGEPHQAGSNSLLTSLFFTKMKRRFWKKKMSEDQDSHKGFIWGINCRVCPVAGAGAVVEHGSSCRCAVCSFPKQALFRCDHRSSCSCRCRSCGSRLVPEQLLSLYHPATCCAGKCAGRPPVREMRVVGYQSSGLHIRQEFIVPCC